MLKLSIIGTSKIVEEHIKVAVEAGFELFSISSTRKNSKNCKKLTQKYNFKHSFNDWRIAVSHSSKYKDISFLIAPRIQDTYKILKMILNKNKKKFVFVEKPITTKINQFKDLIVYKKNVFVGYNRIFYNNIVFLKKNLKKINSVVVKCPEINRKNILHNSVHVISILFYLFGDLKLLNKKKNKNNLFIYLENKKKLPIYIFFNFKAYENFSINIYSHRKKFLLKPLEKLTIYDGINKKVHSLNKNLVEYIPKLKYQNDEHFKNYFKPGFLNQMKAFKEFIKTKKNIYNDLVVSKKIMLVTKKIIS